MKKKKKKKKQNIVENTVQNKYAVFDQHRNKRVLDAEDRCALVS